MKSFISEDDIEQALLKKLSSAPFNYDLIICDPSLDAKDNPDNGPHRDSVEQCIIPSILKESLSRINESHLTKLSLLVALFLIHTLPR